MKFSVNWLREFVELSTDADEVAELLTRAGVEIEQIEERGVKIDKVVVAQICGSLPHPNANRLTICQVEDGSGIQRQIVCGATNYKVGDKVPLALPGAKLAEGLEIRKSKLRGVESEGMLCSAKELRLGDDASGLLILPPEARVGAAIADLFPGDTILDVEITPNRGDLLSHYGLAREIAALANIEIRPWPNDTEGENVKLTPGAGLKIVAPTECLFFSARKINKVKVGPSPQWLRSKIENVGVRSINNIVDVSNFVMLELGQPTHAFDAGKLNGDIVVRFALEGEQFLALDGKTYSLKTDNLVVADQEGAIGIAGVMGGEQTGVTASTEDILLESAYFLPASVRHTARNLNLPSDASYRFERGVDPQMVVRASRRAAQLIAEIANGIPAGEMAVAGRLPENPADVSLSYEKCNRLIGLTLESRTIDQTLTRFGLDRANPPFAAQARRKTIRSNEPVSVWKIPSYRRDLQRDVDLIEEVVRAHGTEKIHGTDRSRFTGSSAADAGYNFECSLRQHLVSCGLSEARTSKLIPRTAIAGGGAIELRNPLSEDHVALRPSLLPGLLAVFDRNLRAGAERVALFELGRVFIPPNAREERRVGILLWGNIASAPHWRAGEKRKLDLLDLKGIIESLSIPELSFQPGPGIEDEGFNSSAIEFSLSVEVRSGNQRIGRAGRLVAAQNLPIEASGAVLFSELNAELMEAVAKTRPSFHEIERFPAVTRDIAMIVPETVTHAQIIDLIQSEKEPLLESVELFDLFTSGLAKDQKSLAYRLTYRDRSRTLTNEEVTAAHAKIRERLQRKLGAELRE
jgi:phenylalanyl-tRNA synthetase beta chain